MAKSELWHYCIKAMIQRTILGDAATSICILRCALKFERSATKMARLRWNTSGMGDTPFLLRARQRYCLMAVLNVSWLRNTGPAFCTIDSNISNERIFERSSWDLQTEIIMTNGRIQLQHSIKGIRLGKMIKIIKFLFFAQKVPSGMGALRPKFLGG